MMVAARPDAPPEERQGLRQDQREGAGGAHRAGLALAARRSRRPPAAPGARCTSDPRPSEVGVLNRIKRVREYAGCSATRCNDVTGSRLVGGRAACRQDGERGKGQINPREPQRQQPDATALRGSARPLKTDERKVVVELGVVELGLDDKMIARSTGWDENRVFLRATSSGSPSSTASWVLTHLPAGTEGGAALLPPDTRCETVLRDAVTAALRYHRWCRGVVCPPPASGAKEIVHNLVLVSRYRRYASGCPAAL